MEIDPTSRRIIQPLTMPGEKLAAGIEVFEKVNIKDLPVESAPIRMGHKTLQMAPKIVQLPMSPELAAQITALAIQHPPST